MVLTQYTRRARRGGQQEEQHSIKTKGKMLVTRKSSSMTRRDHKMHKLYRIPNGRQVEREVNASQTALVNLSACVLLALTSTAC